jgi:hypothetical protein
LAKCWVRILSLNGIVEFDNGKQSKVQHKSILGIFHRRLDGYVDVEYHKQDEKANKFAKIE